MKNIYLHTCLVAGCLSVLKQPKIEPKVFDKDSSALIIIPFGRPRLLSSSLAGSLVQGSPAKDEPRPRIQEATVSPVAKHNSTSFILNTKTRTH